MYLIVVGGGKVGFYLTQTLLSEGHELLLIEKNPRKCEIYEERFGSIVMNGDGAEASTLEAAGAARADVIIAVTGDDEDNLIICQVARQKFNVPRAISRVNNPKNEDIFKRLGITVTVSQTNVILHMIEQQIPEQNVLHLMTLRHAEIEIVNVRVSKTSPVVGRSLAEITLPRDCVFSAITRGRDVIVPTGQTVLKGGDEVIAVTHRDSEHALREMLVGN